MVALTVLHSSVPWLNTELPLITHPEVVELPASYPVTARSSPRYFGIFNFSYAKCEQVLVP